MKKRKIIAGLLLASAALGLASCAETPKDPVNPPVEVTKYTVTFDSKGGTAVSKIEIDANGKITLPTNPTKENNTFKGWFTDEACTKPFDAETAITANITLYAKWEAVAQEVTKYNVTFDGSDIAVLEVKEGDKVTKPTDPTKAGYIFGGWYKEEACTTAWNFDTDVVNADTTLYAKWTKNSEVSQTNAIEMNGVAYETITAALAAIPTSGDTSTYTIRLNKGTYAENGLSYNGTATIHIVGNTNTKYGADVIIKGRGNNMSSMRGRELLEIQGTGNIILENVSLVSDYSRSESTKDAQAEVLGTDTKGNTVAYNCSFKSHQDTLRTAGKAWFYGCYVEGDTDFIWMEASGSVALYENCEIVSVYDEHASTHTSYIAAPRMGVSSKVGKGLVFLNSVVKESDEAKEKGQKTYLARTPWSSGYFNQVAYINTPCSDVELTDGPWYKNQIETEFAKTIIGWKMDSKTAASLNLADKDYIVDDAVTSKEFNGRKSILNRIYNTGKQKYEKDAANSWDIDALIKEYGFVVTKDASSEVLEGETATESTVYTFDGSTDYSSICNGFKQDNAKAHFVGQKDNTITIPVNGKCFVEVYGYYAGTAEIQADTQGYAVAFFNNGSTKTEIENDYIVYDANAKEVVITAKSTTYITKIVVTPDETIAEAKPVTSLDIVRSTKVETVGVAVTLSASLNKDATNKSVVWSSSDTEVADIDAYTGRITFKKEGKVTFTATACDGSGVTKSIECNPTEANWKVCEWYTTDSANILEEEGAEGINNYAPGADTTYKALGAEYTFTNLAGETIKTTNGLKLNSKGQLSIAITKPALLTIVTCDAGKIFATPVVSNGTVTVVPTSITQSEDGKVYTYVYEIADVGMFDIVRGENSQENNPILYAKCEYVEPVIETSTGLTFKGTHYNESKTNIANIYNPSEFIDATGTTIYIEEFKLTNCANNQSVANWLTFNTGATIEFKVSGACTVLVGYYSKLQTIKINGVVVEGNKASVSKGAGEIVEYEIGEAGTVTIEASANDYLGFVGVLFKTLEMRKADAITKLEKAYPAKNYTQNADYATVLQAQKDAINAAADAAAVAAAYEAAVTAMDALEVDKIETPEYAENYSYAAVTDGVESNKYITFVNCVLHNDKYAALKTDNAVTIKVAAGATLTVYMPYSSGITLNGEAYTLVNDTLTYVATEDEAVVITGAAGNAYIETITVTPAPKYADNYSYVFADVAGNTEKGAAVESTDYVVFENCVNHDGSQHIKLGTNNKVTINVAAGATLTVSMLYSSGITLNGEAYTLVDNTLTYTATANEKVVITGEAGKAYIQSITVTPAPKYADNYSYAVANDGVVSNEYVTFVNCVEHNGQYVALKENNSVTIRVAAGATLTVYMPYSSGITLNGEAYTLVDNALTYTATANEAVVITGAAGNAYIETITVTSAE